MSLAPPPPALARYASHDEGRPWMSASLLLTVFSLLIGVSAVANAVPQLRKSRDDQDQPSSVPVFDLEQARSIINEEIERLPPSILLDEAHHGLLDTFIGAGVAR